MRANLRLHTQVDPPGRRILIAGTGGQGVLTAARLLCEVLVEHGHDIVSGQLHGMAQRGGSVQSSVIIDGGISPVIATGQAGFVLGFEPVETARALPFMSLRTMVYMNTTPVIPYALGQRFVLEEGSAEYPNVDELADIIRTAAPSTFPLNGTSLAAEAGSTKALNMVMLGCLLGTGSLPCTADDFWATAAKMMPLKLVDANNRAFFGGVELSKDLQLPAGKP